jgi:hypothetical protein
MARMLSGLYLVTETKTVLQKSGHPILGWRGQ